MKIAIHNSKNSFSNRWIAYCEQKSIPCEIVNCYENNIMAQLEDCDALMWHFHHANSKDCLFAKQLLYALKMKQNFQVFPNFNTAWHFDDKIGQKYLLESIGAPLAPTFIFFSKDQAIEWAKYAPFPIVFKLRGGAGSVNVRLITSFVEAKRLICRAFGRGFKHDSNLPMSDIWKKYKTGKLPISSVFKGIARFFIESDFSKINGKERGYVYFQEYIPGNDHDIRIIVIAEKAFAIKRMTRKDDFRASGSGHILYEKEHFDIGTVQLAFELSQKLQAQCVAFDFVYKNGSPLVVEISYGFSPKGYDPCPGFWDRNLNWHEGAFNPYGWMVDTVMKSITCHHMPEAVL